MKIKIERIEDENDVAVWVEHGDIEIEVPDAIVADWRATRDRLVQLEAYFDEQVLPQIEAEHRRRREEWERLNPEEAERNRQTVNLWSRQLLNEAIRNTVAIRMFGKKLE